MSPAFWKRPRFWEWFELVVAVAALASGVVAVWDRLAGAVWGSECGLLVLVAKFAQKKAGAVEQDGREAFTKRVVGAVLDGLYREYFSQVAADDRHNHRVTLFRCQRAADGGQELVIYRRHGKYQSSATVWKVDDDDLARCEGVAGRIWFLDTKQTVELPDWSDDPAGAAAYAGEGFIRASQAMELRVKSKVLSGTAVRVGGEKWGVLILDSKTPGYITKTKEHMVEWYAELIARVLGEAVR